MIARRTHRHPARGFTLLEVMVAIAILGMGLLTLLGLQHRSLQAIISAQSKTSASMLAQMVMTEAELERFPDLGVTRGNFNQKFPGKFPNFRWQRAVLASGSFPDLRQVTVVISFGPRYTQAFSISEFLHNPTPPEGTSGGSGGIQGGDQQPGVEE
jgi:type II secretion system protein I